MKITNEYVTSLINKFYKLLCLFEEENIGLPQNIDSLIYEIYGLQYLVEENQIPTVVTLISILEHFYDDSLQSTVDIKVIKREVFHCMDLIEKSLRVGD